MSEILKEKLGDELYSQITSKLGDLKIDIISNAYIPKDRFNTVNDENKALKNELTNRNTQLEELKKTSQGNEELTKKIEELTQLNTQSALDYESKIKDMSLNIAIEKALTSNNAKYVDLLSSKIDKTKLSLEADNINGLDEQINVLKENYKDMFITKVVGNTPNTNTSLDINNKDNDVLDKLRHAAGLK
jgi:hypothetical protein